MGLRAVFPEFTRSAEIWFVRVATALFAIIVVGALAANWSTFISHLPVMGPVVIGLNVAMLAIGFVVAKLFGLPSRDARTISIEAGIQNSTLGIAVGSILSSATLGDYALPSAVYSGVLYLVTLPIVFFILRRL